MRKCNHCGKPKAECKSKIDKQLNADFTYSRNKVYDILETMYSDKESNIGRIMMIGNWMTVTGEHIMRAQNKGKNVEEVIKDLNTATRENIEDQFKKGKIKYINRREFEKSKTNPTARYVS